MRNPPDLAAVSSTVPEAQVISLLGEGGFKVAYRAMIGGRLEALKLIEVPSERESPEASSEISARVRREIEALEIVDSPYLVRLGSLSPSVRMIGDRQYVVYSEELLEGPSLRQEIREGKRPAACASIVLLRCLTRAIGAMWARDLIHRDIKPDNVVAQADAQRPYVLLDLGVAFKLHSTPITRDPDLRQGTLPYMAPEVFNPRYHEALDYRSDLYSAAVTVYEHASGIHPIARTHEDDFTTMGRIARMVPRPLAQLRSDFPQAFCQIVDQLMKKSPALRPADLVSLAKELGELI
jgi:serine/threonine protein kinase